MFEFVRFAEMHGLIIKNGIDDSGDIIRVSTTEKPHSKNGSYSWDGRHGWVQNWNRAEHPVFYQPQYVQKLPDEERKKIIAKREENESRRAVCASAVKMEIERAIKSGKTTVSRYMQSKGFKNHAMIVVGNDTVVPMYHYNGYELIGYQRIIEEPNGEYTKKMAFGMQAKGAIHIIGSRSADAYILCEGYATGVSIMQAIKASGMSLAVVVCFSARNLADIGTKLKSRPGYVYADNDENGIGEIAAKNSGLPYCMSDKLGNDANDDMREFGIQYLINKINSAKQSKPT